MPNGTCRKRGGLVIATTHLNVSSVVGPLAAAIKAAGGPDHLDRLIDLIAASVPHDKVTVVRYSASRRPEFVSWRNYSAELVQKYLEYFYVYDPFYALWRSTQQQGVVHLDNRPESRLGPYIADFLGESDIVDEIGVLLEDGGDWALGIFLDRSGQAYSPGEVAHVADLFPVFDALHAQNRKRRGEVERRTDQKPSPGAAPATPSFDPEDWPALSPREREIVALVLKGHPPSGIASRLGITPGTVKNHRRNIYLKLDITSERELFLLHLQGAQLA